MSDQKGDNYYIYNNTYAVYLAGPISGLAAGVAAKGWRDEFTAILHKKMGRPEIQILSPMRKKLSHIKAETVIGGFKSHHNGPAGISSPKGTIARDFHDIGRADIIVCCLRGAKAVSIGTIAELGAAKLAGKNVVLVMGSQAEWDKNPHNHGWVPELAAFHAVTLEEAAAAVDAFCSTGL